MSIKLESVMIFDLKNTEQNTIKNKQTHKQITTCILT